MTSTKDTILIVDDNPTNLQLLFDYLQDAGFKVLIAEDGESALQRAIFTTPDIILLDVMMPNIDGFETCWRLKENEQTKDIPIIFMTALSDTVDEVKGLQLGAVDYIIKPFKVETVLARVNTHLNIQNMKQELQRQNDELQLKNQLLQEALDIVKTLRGLLPICANCKNIRDDAGYWLQVEEYIQKYSEADFSHSICPDCLLKLYPEFYTQAVRE